MKKSGFTLIELLVVISIIGLLASIILASLSSARNSATVAAGKTFISNSNTALYNATLVYINFDNDNYGVQSVTTPTITTALIGGPSTNGNQDCTPGQSLTKDISLYNQGYQLTIAPSGTLGCNALFVSNGAIGTAVAGGNFSLSVWFNPAQSCASDDCLIAGLDPWGNGNTASIVLSNSSIFGQMNIGAGPTTYQTALVPISIGQWSNILFSVQNVSGNETESLYVNGKLAASTSGTGTFGSGNNQLTIGESCCAAYRAAGIYDNVAMYSNYLTLSQANELYQQGFALLGRQPSVLGSSHYISMSADLPKHDPIDIPPRRPRVHS